MPIPTPMNSPFVKINNTVINMNSVAAIKSDGGNVVIDFVSGGDQGHRIILSGREALRFEAFLLSVSHVLT